MNRTPRDPTPLGWRKADQVGIAFCVLLALVSMAMYWTAVQRHGGLIDIREAPRRSAHYAVDVNQASWPELAQLPGIGETLVRRIVEMREAEGPFLDESDLLRVRGIGPRTLERIRPHLLPLPGRHDLAGD